MNSNEKDSRLEINNIIVPGVISNKISEKINNNKFVIVSIGLVKHKINDVLNISIVFILNLLISIKIKGVTVAIIIAIAENKQTKTTLYFINEKNLILK
ncbi:MAG: hypothetical protein E7D28_04830 [Clostridium sp.]|jgi:hypothetical protein|nr:MULTISPECIES: hypothetical protein [Clostridium]MDB1934504.1 hypothetical protein [Clostridium tertium]MDB1937632.1 hypothetical protein [Clostridium tertium]MDB1943675.1 hypothetical protein [Clostridium tertium]MDB1951641.1 hypothetical protein [Clostridium tertium]MDB1969814.1 hypothetical protein [Clostridium tertium]